MTYLKPPLMSYYRVPGRALRRPMGDAFDDALAAQKAGARCDACDAAGREAQAVYDAQMKAIAAQWQNRDDFYYVADIDALMQQGYAFVNAGYAVIDKVSQAYGDAANYPLQNAQQLAYNKLQYVSQTALDFQIAVNNAKNSGATVIDAPGLRGWIIDAVSAAGYAAYVAAYTQAAMPAGAAAIIAVLRTFTAVGQALIALVKKIAIVLEKAGEVVYKTTVNTLDIAASLAKLAAQVAEYGPQIAIGLGAFWLWKKSKKA